MTTDFVEFWHEVHDGMNGSRNVCKIMCEVDIGCDSISLLRWKSILKIVLSILGVTHICHVMLKWKKREREPDFEICRGYNVFYMEILILGTVSE